MCGIAGFVTLGRRPREACLADLRRMTDAIAHRGPDGAGHWAAPEGTPSEGAGAAHGSRVGDGGQGRTSAESVAATHATGARVFLGHRRLAILDLETGAQPLWDATGRAGIVFNGEIYNHAELRRELEGLGHRFLTHHSDTETVLVGYLAWGAAVCDRLNGMWALAIHDRARGEIFLSRDRFGKKPLYYTWARDVDGTPLFAFASELTALQGHGALSAPTVSRRALRKYFAYGYIPAPLSLHEGVFKLPGGHHLTLDLRAPQDTPSPRRYWSFTLEPARVEATPARDAEWAEELRALLDRATRRRLMADVDVGVFLSGGVDSSAVTAFAARAKPGLRTFSIGFEEASFDESAYSARVAALFGTRHHARTLSVAAGRDLLPEILGRLDEPVGDTSLLPTYLLSRETARHVKVALGGDGADELFAGYDPFRALSLARAYARWVPRPVHEGIRMLAARLPVSHRNMSLDFKIKRTLRGLSYDPRLWNPIWLGPLSPAELSELFREPMDLEDLYSEAIAAWDECADPDPVGKTLQFYTNLYLQDDILPKVDRMSMLNSLEVRAPFLDIELVNFARRLPHPAKFRAGVGKYILKKAMEPLLPAEILYRPKKGFGTPVGDWLQSGGLEFSDARVAAAVNPTYLRARIDEHRRGRADHRAFLWNEWVLGARGPRSGRPEA